MADQEGTLGRCATAIMRLWVDLHLTHAPWMGTYCPMVNSVFFCHHKDSKFWPNSTSIFFQIISEKYIQDKSKCSELGKFLVCVQAFWFCVQFFVRLVNGMGVSVLELNAFAHALCTFVIYLMWWDKPYDVEDSTVISGERGTEVAALFSTWSPDIPVLYIRPDSQERRHGNDICLTRLGHHGLQSCPEFSSISKFSSNSKKCELELPDGFTRLYIGGALHGFLFDAAIVKSGFSENDRRRLEAATDQFLCHHVDLSSNQRQRFEMAERAVERYELDQDRLAELESQAPLLVTEVSNHGLPAEPSVGDITEYATSYILASLPFGLLCLTAWDAPFTAGAQIVWRFGVLIILVSGPVFLIMLKSRPIVGDSLGYFCIFFNMYGKATLLIVSFCSLWWLPNSVYDVPSWSQYFPHIG